MLILIWAPSERKVPLFCCSLIFQSLKPFKIGKSDSKMKIPIIPTIIPTTSFSQTKTRHKPTPRDNAPIMLTASGRIHFFDKCMGAFFSIFRHTKIVISPRKMPTVPKIIPTVNIFHSGSSAMHIPNANNVPLIIPKTNAVKLLLFILKPSEKDICIKTTVVFFNVITV